MYYSVHSGYFSPQALRLSQASLKETTTGQIVNLVTSDIQRLEQVNSSICPACVNDFRDLNLILSFCWEPFWSIIKTNNITKTQLIMAVKLKPEKIQA